MVVHGAVQGVGYRAFVRDRAARYGVKGMVRNADDGSVQILAEASKERLEEFKAAIDVGIAGGPQVHNIEVFEEGGAGFPRGAARYVRFEVEKE